METTEQRLMDHADELIAWVEQAKDFAEAQAPLVVEEMLRYGFWSNLLEASVGFLLIATAVSAVCLLVKHMKSLDDIEDTNPAIAVPCGFAATICFMVGSPIFFINAKTLLMLCLAPRLYIIEQLKDLVL